MQIRENRTRIVGHVRAVRPSEALEGYVEADVEVEIAGDVAGVANLLAGSAGRVLPVRMTRATAERTGVRPGRRLACEARRGTPRPGDSAPVLAQEETVRATDD